VLGKGEGWSRRFGLSQA